MNDGRKQAGRVPIGVKWVDASKGDAESPEYRCRQMQVGREGDKA